MKDSEMFHVKHFYSLNEDHTLSINSLKVTKLAYRLILESKVKNRNIIIFNIKWINRLHISDKRNPCFTLAV
jgi:hypothetical protein